MIGSITSTAPSQRSGPQSGSRGPSPNEHRIIEEADQRYHRRIEQPIRVEYIKLVPVAFKCGNQFICSEGTCQIEHEFYKKYFEFKFLKQMLDQKHNYLSNQERQSIIIELQKKRRLFNDCLVKMENELIDFQNRIVEFQKVIDDAVTKCIENEQREFIRQHIGNTFGTFDLDNLYKLILENSKNIELLNQYLIQDLFKGFEEECCFEFIICPDNPELIKISIKHDVLQDNPNIIWQSYSLFLLLKPIKEPTVKWNGQFDSFLITKQEANKLLDQINGFKRLKEDFSQEVIAMLFDCADYVETGLKSIDLRTNDTVLKRLCREDIAKQIKELPEGINIPLPFTLGVNLASHPNKDEAKRQLQAIMYEYDCRDTDGNRKTFMEKKPNEFRVNLHYRELDTIHPRNRSNMNFGLQTLVVEKLALSNFGLDPLTVRIETLRVYEIQDREWVYSHFKMTKIENYFKKLYVGLVYYLNTHQTTCRTKLKLKHNRLKMLSGF